MLINSESKAPGGAEVVPMKLVLLHLEPRLEELEGLVSPNGDVAGDLLVPPDGEGTDGVPGLGEHGLRAADLHGGAGESPTIPVHTSLVPAAAGRGLTRVTSASCLAAGGALAER